MSGLFKSFSNFVSRSTLAQANNYLLRQTNQTLHPTAYYYNGEVLQQGHGLDIFQLSVTTAALTHQANDYLDLLKNLEQSNQVKKEIQERLNSNIISITNYFSSILNQLKYDQELTVQSVADIIYVLAYGPLQREDALDIIQDKLVTVLKGPKLHWASSQNLQDIINSLNKLNFNDNALFTQLLNELNSREHQFVNVKTHAWTVDQYEKCCSKCNWNVLSCNHNYFREYVNKGGSNSSYNRLKFWFTELFDGFTYRIINPLFFREKRIYRRFEGRNNEIEIFKLIDTLEQLESKIPDQKQVILQLKERYQQQ